MKKLDVVTFGETMVLFQANEYLPIEYIHQFQKQIGGAESNVAIGLSRLGHTVGWFSKLGQDPFGRYIQKFIRGEGVDTSSCLYTKEAPTGVFFKEKRSAEDINVFYYRKNSAASFLAPEDLNEDYIASAKILHITGITPALSDTAKESVFAAIKIAKKHGLTIVFDPNLRLKLWSKEAAQETCREIAQFSDVILPGFDEGELITGKTTPEEIASELIGSQDKVVIIKLGSRGAYYQTSQKSGYVAGFPVKQVVDPVGAGDGFAAGIISGLLRNDSLEETVKRANAIGAIVVGVHGDVEGLPTNEEITGYLSNDSNKRDVNR
jgi:2-dehydro-3-deoxygluconokinase